MGNKMDNIQPGLISQSGSTRTINRASEPKESNLMVGRKYHKCPRCRSYYASRRRLQHQEQTHWTTCL